MPTKKFDKIFYILPVWIQYTMVTDRQTDRWTDTMLIHSIACKNYRNALIYHHHHHYFRYCNLLTSLLFWRLPWIPRMSAKGHMGVDDASCTSCKPTNSVKALKDSLDANIVHIKIKSKNWCDWHDGLSSLIMNYVTKVLHL